MKNLTRLPLFVAGVFLILSLFVVSPGMVEGQTEPPTKLPPGNWSFSAHPYFGEGYDSRPVVVISVTTSSEQGLVVNEIGLKNLSSKAVAAVKLTWRLSTEQDRESILLQNQTPLIAVSDGIPVGKRRLLKFPVLSFARIHKPFLVNGSLSGDFRIEVEVSEILYDDGSTSALNNPNRFSVVKATSLVKPSLQVACARQRCKYVANPGAHYECELSTNAEYCNNRESSCCNVLCGEKPPGHDGFWDI